MSEMGMGSQSPENLQKSKVELRESVIESDMREGASEAIEKSVVKESPAETLKKEILSDLRSAQKELAALNGIEGVLGVTNETRAELQKKVDTLRRQWEIIDKGASKRAAEFGTDVLQ